VGPGTAPGYSTARTAVPVHLKTRFAGAGRQKVPGILPGGAVRSAVRQETFYVLDELRYLRFDNPS
jgi:hypothetical protein